jgi:hypothetical protein
MTEQHAEHPPSSSAATVPSGRITGYCLAIVSVAAAVIHYAVASENFQPHWTFAVLMLIAAWLQLGWAIALVARPSRLLLWGGAILNVAVVAVYLATRPAGDAVENGVSLALGAIVTAGCGWLLAARAEHQVRRQRLVMVPAAAAAATAVVLGVALAAGGPVASASGSTASTSGTAASGAMPGMQMPGMAASSIKLANTSHAGDITMPDTSMQMMDGMRMASSKACTATPTKAQQEATVSMVNTSWKDAKKYQSLAAAKAAGYVPITPSGEPVVHYLNMAYYQAVLKGGPVLNYTEPQSLVWANTPNGAVLVAAMYITSPGGPTPQPGGCLTQWHVHTNLCLTGTLDVVGAVGQGNSTCPPGSANRVTPSMIHVWFVPIPGGPTAIDAPNDQVVQAAEQVHAPVNGTA